MVFDEQVLNQAAPSYQQEGMLHVQVVTEATPSAQGQPFMLSQPSLASKEPQHRLAALATSFLGWQLSMALYGYLQRIQFAGQPAVENYKARARALRTQPDPLQIASHWRAALQAGMLTLLAPGETISQNAHANGNALRSEAIASLFASVVQKAASANATPGHPQHISLGYLDLTINGETQADLLAMLTQHVHTIGNRLLGVPVKLRHAPAYHSTEQSEMDGPPYLVSLRLVARNTEACLLGSYTNTFLHAQAVSTWQAMLEMNHPCFLLVIDGSLDDALKPLFTFFSEIELQLHRA